MGKRRKSRINAPQTNNPNVQFPTSLSLKLEPDTLVRVAIDKPEQPPPPINIALKVLSGAVITLFLILLSLFVIYIQPRQSYDVKISGTSLSTIVSHNSYVAFGDEAEIDITIRNDGNESANGALVLLFNGNIHTLPLPSETTKTDIKELVPGASSTHRLKFALGYPPQWFSNKMTHLTVIFVSGKQQFRSQSHSAFSIAPIPYLRTVSFSLLGSALTGAIAMLLWEVIRKRLFGWEAQ